MSAEVSRPPMPAETLFFAVRPPPAIASEISRLTHRSRDLFGLKGAAIPEERLHATLALVGDYDSALVETASRAMASLQARPLHVTFDRMYSFKGKPGGMPLVLGGGDGVMGLRFLQKLLVSEMRRVGLVGAGKSSFTPHVTLLYDRTPVPETPIDPISWPVREIVLVHSLVGQGRHIDLKTWPLV